MEQVLKTVVYEEVEAKVDELYNLGRAAVVEEIEGVYRVYDAGPVEAKPAE